MFEEIEQQLMEPINEILPPVEGEPDIRHCTVTEVMDYRK